MASEEQGATQGAVLDKAAAEAALVTALEGVERYLLVRAKADAALRAGWLNIARARHAMGLHRVPPPPPSPHSGGEGPSLQYFSLAAVRFAYGLKTGEEDSDDCFRVQTATGRMYHAYICMRAWVQ